MIQMSLNEGDSPFPRGDDSERVKIHRNLKKEPSPEPAGKINRTSYKLSFGEGNSSLFK
jgi:hypothetical protein